MDAQFDVRDNRMNGTAFFIRNKNPISHLRGDAVPNLRLRGSHDFDIVYKPVYSDTYFEFDIRHALIIVGDDDSLGVAADALKPLSRGSV